MTRALSLVLLSVLAMTAEVPPAPAQPPVTVSDAVGKLLDRARLESDPAKAEALLAAYDGAPNAVVATALGNARLQVAEAAPEAQRAPLRTKAREAYANATQLDPSFTAAHIGLARCAALGGDWKAALAGCAAGIPPATAAPEDLAFFIDCAARAGDRRLAANLVSQALVRHPGYTVFRRQELALLIGAERWEEARSALLALLDAAPTDAQTWRSLASLRHRSGDAEASRIALEAALLLTPDDAALRRSLAEAQLAAGQAPAALATLQPLIAAPATTDPKLVEFAARAAIEADRPDQARAWLAALPTEKRTRSSQLLLVRLAAQGDDLDATDAAMKELLRAGESDAAVLTWAGSIAERKGDLPRAEALYRQADAQGPGPSTLRLALVLHRVGRNDEARRALGTYRQQFPADPQLPLIERIVDGK